MAACLWKGGDVMSTEQNDAEAEAEKGRGVLRIADWEPGCSSTEEEERTRGEERPESLDCREREADHSPVFAITFPSSICYQLEFICEWTALNPETLL